MNSFKKILLTTILIFSFNGYSQTLTFFSNEACDYNYKISEQNFHSIKSGFMVNLDTNEYSMLTYTKSNKQNPVVTKFKFKRSQTDDESTLVFVKVDDNGKTDSSLSVTIDYVTKSLFYFSGKKVTLFKILDPSKVDSEW